MTPAVSSTYIETWSELIMTVGQGMLAYRITLLNASIYYLTKNYSVKSVVIGFIIGGFVLLVDDALFSVTVIHLFANNPTIDQSIANHLYRNITLGRGLVVGVCIGTLGATASREQF